jgi:cob(I)alamin adenosyltransferase
MSDTPNITEQSPEKQAKRREARQKNEKKGLVIVNTGEGKGKTTAALGTVLRARGRDMRVCVVQFLKHEKGAWGETRLAEALGIDWVKTGDGFTWTSKDMDETVARGRHGWQIAQEKIASGNYDLILLDEFTYPMTFGWIDTREVIEWLQQNKPAMMHLIITGRNAPPELVEYADLVSEVRKVKHPFDIGIRAQKGIEF